MQWNMDFDISALVILFVIITLQLSRQYTSVRRSHIFLSMVVLEIATILCNILVRNHLIGMEGTYGIFEIVLIDVFFALQYLVPLFFMYYMIVWSGRSLKINQPVTLFFLAPIVVYVVMIVRNCMTQNLYVFDKEHGYLETDMIMILSGIAVYSMLFGLIYAIFNIRLLSFGRLTMIGVLVALVGAGTVVQYYIPDMVFIDFMIAIALLVLYLVAQNPADMLDSNTQVLNRNMMDELLRTDIASGKEFDLVVLALDDFKFVNKTFGVTTGDMMLMQVAHFLTTLSKKGTVYRYGADQFALQLRHSDVDMETVLEFIKERFRHPWITEEVSVMLSTTISCVSYPGDGNSLETIVDVIDYSVLSAKTNGKGSIVYARDMDLHTLRKEKAIEKALELAIDRDMIEVHYQPIFNTEKQCYTSAEALVRLHDDRLGNISPEVFIPIAEKNGMILKLGTMIFEKVCRFISEQNLKDTSIEYIEVNVSVVQCMQQDFVENLIDIMERYHIDPSQINLEVTETAAVNSLAILQENIEKLHAKGISFSLDDYGSGYSTLGYLHQLPFQIIKLDKLMVWDAFENERAGITLKFTVGMLKELKVRIVAEGVETKEQQIHLTGIGCDYLQGWYYSKAIPEDEFAALIKEAC
ncbi:MAG: putative bifunctional diguanylate cyclase/phosphodiesterase [Lachnospiraceae bacterium]